MRLNVRNDIIKAADLSQFIIIRCPRTTDANRLCHVIAFAEMGEMCRIPQANVIVPEINLV